jgi:uncharacterized delta-60 repeat protein
MRKPFMHLRPGHRYIVPALALLALIPCFPGCSSDDDDDDTTVDTGNTFLIKEEHDFETGDSVYSWQAPGGAVRVTVDIEDFHHGDVLVTIFDAVGQVIYQKLFWSWDGYWYVGDWEVHDVDVSQPGVGGLWTIELEFDEYAGDIEVFLESTSSGPPPDTPDELPPPSSTSSLLDASYGSQGRASYTPGLAAGRKVVIDANGRAVVAGTLIDSGNQRHLAAWRFLASGNIDTAFGAGGVFVFDGGEESAGFGVALDLFQNVLISGLIDVSPGVTNLVVVRLTPTGDLDPAFGAAGAAIVEDGGTDIGNSVAVAQTGRILVAGSSTNPDGTGEAILVALTNAGILDGTFGGGIARTGGPLDRGWDLALDGAGRVLLAGVRGNGLALWRYTINGILDGTFATGGIAIDPGASGEFRAGRAVAVAGDGSIGVAGVRLFSNGIPAQLAVWRFTETGAPLLSFQTIGFGAYAYPAGPALGTDIAFDSSGRILVLGITSDDGSNDSSATLWRLLSTGTPDGTLKGSGGAGFTLFDDRSGNSNTAASGFALGATSFIATGGGADRSTGAADLLVWKLVP